MTDPHDYDPVSLCCVRCGIGEAWAEAYRLECKPAQPARPGPQPDVFSRPVHPRAFDHIGRGRL